MTGMGTWALLLAVAAPWLALGLLAVPALRARPPALLPLAALPALLLAVGSPDVQVAVPGVLDGARLALDNTARAFLLPGAALWLLAGGFAYLRPGRHRLRFAVFWLLTLAGYTVLVLAADLLTFYSGFALMTFAAYGLVTHAADPEALRAGRLYLGMMLLGEVALFTAVSWTTLATAPGRSPALAELGAALPPGAALLFAVGFGMKLGALGLHAWLPRAHAVAPIPASAVLSGVMIKAGALGVWRLVEGGLVLSESWGVTLMVLGLSGTFYAAGAGLLRQDAKTVLAWSSVSQMGLLVTLLGAVLAPSVSGLSAGMAWAGLAVMVAHHGLAKGALFLGTGLTGSAPAGAPRAVLLTGLALAAAALAAAPFSGGALVKAALTMGNEAGAAALPGWLAGLTSTVTALLMLHFLQCVRTRPPASAEAADTRGRGVWLTLLLLALILPWWMTEPSMRAYVTGVPGLWAALWPLVLAAGIFALAVRSTRFPAPGLGGRGASRTAAARLATRVDRGMVRSLALAERRLHRWPLIGRIATGLIVLLAVALWSVL